MPKLLMKLAPRPGLEPGTCGLAVGDLWPFSALSARPHSLMLVKTRRGSHSEMDWRNSIDAPGIVSVQGLHPMNRPHECRLTTYSVEELGFGLGSGAWNSSNFQYIFDRCDVASPMSAT